MGAISETNKGNLRIVAEVMKAAGYKSFRIDFDGCGDSGTFEPPVFTDMNGEPKLFSFDDTKDNNPGDNPAHRKITYYVYRAIYSKDTSDYEKVKTEESNYLDSAITEIVEDIVNETHVNWYDNEGGGGHFSFDATTLEVDFEVYYNIVERETGAEFCGNLDDDEGDV